MLPLPRSLPSDRRRTCAGCCLSLVRSPQIRRSGDRCSRVLYRPPSLALSLVRSPDPLCSTDPPLPRPLPSARQRACALCRTAGRRRIRRSGDRCSNPPLLSLLRNPNPRSGDWSSCLLSSRCLIGGSGAPASRYAPLVASSISCLLLY
jgi:hypothetical protein